MPRLGPPRWYLSALHRPISDGGDDTPSIALLWPDGPGPGQIGSGILEGTDGQPVTTTRASVKVVPLVEDESTVVVLGNDEPAVGPKGLLVEVAHTNRMQQSQNIGTAPWNIRGTVAVVSNDAIAPDGTLTADLVTGVGTFGENDFYQAAGGFAVGAVAPSFWIKKVTAAGTLKCGDPASGTGSWLIDLDLIGSGWERITINHPAVTVETPFTNAGGSNGTQFGAAAGGPLEFHIWGVQAENGNVSHSYVPTVGAVVAGAKDQVTMDGEALPSTTGSVTVDFTPLWSASAGAYIFDTRAAGPISGVAVYVDASEQLVLVTASAADESVITSAPLAWVPGQTYRITATWGAGNTALSRDGDLVAEINDGSAIMPDDNDILRIGEDYAGNSQADGYLSALGFFPGALPD